MPHPEHSSRMPGWNLTGACPGRANRWFAVLMCLALALTLAPMGMLGTGSVLVAKAAAADRKPPHVLVICADDHAAYVTSAEGNPLVRTPNIDRLARGG